MTNFVKSAKNVFLTFFSNFSYFCLKCDKNMGIRSSDLLRFTHTTAERSTDHDMISCLHVATFYDQVLLHFGGAVPKAPLVPKAPTSPTYIERFKKFKKTNGSSINSRSSR